MGQKARTSQAKSFRTDVSPTTEHGKGTGAKNRNNPYAESKTESRSTKAKRPEHSTTDQGKGSDVKSETIQTRQPRQCPEEPKGNVQNIGQRST